MQNQRRGGSKARCGLAVWFMCFSRAVAFHPNVSDSIWDGVKPHATLTVNGTTSTQWNFTVEFDTNVMAFTQVSQPK
jgi:hypothetical protein